MKAIKFETEYCVRCLRNKAKYVTGHVIKDGEHILAGWCERCLKQSEGFSGRWEKRMKLKPRWNRFKAIRRVQT